MSKSVLDWRYEQKKLPSSHYQVEKKRFEHSRFFAAKSGYHWPKFGINSKKIQDKVD